jgi:hypothetical protein
MFAVDYLIYSHVRVLAQVNVSAMIALFANHLKKNYSAIKIQ